IDPFVARIEQPYDFVANPAEVDAMFELPLSLVMAPDAFQTEAVTVQGKRRSFYSMRYGDHYIWGATAGILVNFRRKLEDQCAS
ncbi:MAG: coenzyme A pyrophosphatase, partial [Pseudomonadota bacterium]